MPEMPPIFMTFLATLSIIIIIIIIITVVVVVVIVVVVVFYCPFKLLFGTGYLKNVFL